MSCKRDGNDAALCFIFSGVIPWESFDTKQLCSFMRFFCSRGQTASGEHGHLNGSHGLMIEKSVRDCSRCNVAILVRVLFLMCRIGTYSALSK